MAIPVALLIYNNKPSPSLPRGITLNTIVLLLATGSKSSLLFVTSESIGQLKWIWFRKEHRLSDIQAFDSASRGPWGSFLLLYQHRGHSLVSLGTLTTLYSVAFDPFMQQLLVPQSPGTELFARRECEAGLSSIHASRSIKRRGLRRLG